MKKLVVNLGTLGQSIKKLEKFKIAIIRLNLANILTDGEANKARQKLMKQITKRVKVKGDKQCKYMEQD